ncbi:hypothetical protein C8R44DRAFT_987731 [Mycena epipterygia]|nr:hypothetical protein C8R44DRAFT_987731 [Mycena epipterygia]
MVSGSLDDWMANPLGLNHLTLAGRAAEDEEDEEDARLDDGAVEILDEDEYQEYQASLYIFGPPPARDMTRIARVSVASAHAHAHPDARIHRGRVQSGLASDAILYLHPERRAASRVDAQRRLTPAASSMRAFVLTARPARRLHHRGRLLMDLLLLLHRTLPAPGRARRPVARVVRVAPACGIDLADGRFMHRSSYALSLRSADDVLHVLCARLGPCTVQGLAGRCLLSAPTSPPVGLLAPGIRQESPRILSYGSSFHRTPPPLIAEAIRARTPGVFEAAHFMRVPSTAPRSPPPALNLRR